MPKDYTSRFPPQARLRAPEMIEILADEAGPGKNRRNGHPEIL
jgi:hypothetical protein